MTHQDPDIVATKFSHLNGKKHRMAIFAYYRSIYDNAQKSICRLYKWEAQEGQLTGALLCAWLDDDLYYER